LVGVGNARVNGDPHYHTFDGNTIHFQGGCTYQITGLCHHAIGTTFDDKELTNFKVYAKNFQKIKTKKNRAMAWIQDVIVEIPLADSKIFVFIGQGLEVKVSYQYNNGSHHTEHVSTKQLPYQINDEEGKFTAVLYKHQKYLRVQIGNDGLVVQFNGMSNFKIYMPCEYNGNVCGLLGNADNDPSNDIMMPNGELATSHSQLGDSWLMNDFPEFMGLNTIACEHDSQHTPEEPECPALDLREAATVCTSIIDTRYNLFGLIFLRNVQSILSPRVTTFCGVITSSRMILNVMHEQKLVHRYFCPT
jgi:hypothetical protein